MSYYDHPPPQHQHQQQQVQQQSYPPYNQNHGGRTDRGERMRGMGRNNGNNFRANRPRQGSAPLKHDGVPADVVVVVAVDLLVASLDPTGQIQHLPEDVLRERFSIEPNWSFDDISRYLATLPGSTGCRGWPREVSPAFSQAKVTYGLNHRKISNEHNWSNMLTSVANGAKAMSITVTLPLGPLAIRNGPPPLHERMALDAHSVPPLPNKRKDPETGYSSLRHNGNAGSSKRPHIDDGPDRHDLSRRPPPPPHQHHQGQQYQPHSHQDRGHNFQRRAESPNPGRVPEAVVQDNLVALKKAYADEEEGKFSLKLGDRRLYLNDRMLSSWAVAMARARDGTTLVRPPTMDNRYDPFRAVPYTGPSTLMRSTTASVADWTSMSVKQLSEHSEFSNHFTEDLVKTIVDDVGVVSVVALQKLWKLGNTEKIVPKAGQRMEIDIVLEKWDAKIAEAEDRRKRAEEERQKEIRATEDAIREREELDTARRREDGHSDVADASQSETVEPTETAEANALTSALEDTSTQSESILQRPEPTDRQSSESASQRGAINGIDDRTQMQDVKLEVKTED